MTGDMPFDDPMDPRYEYQLPGLPVKPSVWLAEYTSHLRSNILGIVSDPEKGRQACQDVANEYFGAKNTPPLNWHGDDGHASTSYSNPVETFFFQVTRFTVDEIREDTS